MTYIQISEIITPDAAVTLEVPRFFLFFPLRLNKRELTEYLFTLLAFDNP